jgi:hypothetical protein
VNSLDVENLDAYEDLFCNIIYYHLMEQGDYGSVPDLLPLSVVDGILQILLQ